MNISLFIFDFDGTIADTRESICATVEQTLFAMGCPLVDRNEVTEMIGLPLKATFERLTDLSGPDLDNAVLEYRDRYDQIALETVTLFPDVAETLQKLHDLDLKLAVASSKGRDALKKLLEKLKVIDYFSFIVGEQDVENKKPAPDMVLKILHESRVPADSAIVVGDTHFDVNMGSSAGCLTCAVDYGYGKPELIAAANPDFTISSFTQLLTMSGIHAISSN